MTDKGTCQKHGEFILMEGCHQCLADKMGKEGNTEARIAEAVKVANQTSDRLQVQHIKAQHERLNMARGTDPNAWRTGEEEIRLEPKAEAAIALRPGEDIEAHGYYNEALGLLKHAEDRVIVTVEDDKEATDDLSIISKLKKTMDGKKKEYLAPLKEKVEAIRATYDYLMTPILEAERITRVKMTTFKLEQKRIAQEAEELNRQAMEVAQKQAAMNSGEFTADITPVDVKTAPRLTRTDSGLSGLVDSWKYRVVDIEKIPRAYMMPDDAMLKSIAKQHHGQKQIAGVEFYNEPHIAMRAR